MKTFIAAAAAAFCTAAAGAEAPQPAATAGGEFLSPGEAKARAALLLADEIKFNHLTYDPSRQDEVERYYYSQAVERWTLNRTLAGEARRLGLTATRSEINIQILKMDKVLRAKRGISAKEFIENCPFGSEAMMKDVENAVLIDKLLKREVFDKIAVTPEETAKHMKPAKGPLPEKTAAALAARARNAARREKFPAAFREYAAALMKRSAAADAPAQSAPAGK